MPNLPKSEPSPAEIAARAAIVRSQWTAETFAVRSRHYATTTNYVRRGNLHDADEAGWTPPTCATPAIFDETAMGWHR